MTEEKRMVFETTNELKISKIMTKDLWIGTEFSQTSLEISPNQTSVKIVGKLFRSSIKTIPTQPSLWSITFIDLY